MAKRKGGDFAALIQNSYQWQGSSIALGAAMLDGAAIEGACVSLPLKTLNRHGLIAGATGTGKTKTLQHIVGELSRNGVPGLVMDIKGDLSGIAAAGEASEVALKRAAAMGSSYKAEAFPVEFLSLSDETGARLRATVSEFGPLLMARLLDLNETQTGVLAAIFKFCDDKGLLLLDLKDLKKTLDFASGEGKAQFAGDYGQVSTSSASTILRKIVALEQQGAEIFFGEPSFDVQDLLRKDGKGRGIVSVVRLVDLQNKPDLFSTFMLQVLAEVYSSFPEVGDLEKPKLAIFIDEAHLVFESASKALLEQLEMIVRLIRSKGVAVVFCTQSPTDVPPSILAQLGFKVQHALRAFTARDRKAIKAASENFPETEYYQVDRLLNELGVGEALVTALSEKGKPTPLAQVYLAAPASRMGPLTPAELQTFAAASPLVKKYAAAADRESAYELLSKKAQEFGKTDAREKPASRGGRKVEEKSTLERVASSPIVREVGRTVARELTRGVLGVFGLGKRRR
ncbi:MAG: DUF853 domain-containing protein [Leptospirales bacterium]|nr:DUF853 domain-containing protein [Leptospirales bacterium]